MRRLLALLDTPAGRAARYLFSALLVAAFVWSVDWHQLAAVRGQFDATSVTLAALIAGLTFPLHAWRWWLLLRAQGLTLSLHWAHVVTWIGNFYNAFLLGGLGGDAARAFYVCRDEPARQAAGLAATFFDRVLGLVVLLSIAALALLLKLETVARHTELRLLLVLCAALSLASVLAFVFLLRRPPAWLATRLGPDRTATLAEIFTRARSSPSTFLLSLAISYAIWLLDFVSVWLLARSVGLPLPFSDICVAVSVAYAATVLPISVGGHGVREGTMLAVLALLGNLPPVDTAVNERYLLLLLCWGTSVLWSLVGGGVLLFTRRWRPAAGA